MREACHGRSPRSLSALDDTPRGRLAQGVSFTPGGIEREELVPLQFRCLLSARHDDGTVHDAGKVLEPVLDDDDRAPFAFERCEHLGQLPGRCWVEVRRRLVEHEDRRRVGMHGTDGDALLLAA